MKRAVVLPALCAALLAQPALAQWNQLGTLSYYPNGISTPDGTHLFVAGDDIDTSGTFPTIHPRVSASDDSGQTFNDISGSLGTQSGLNQTTAIAFADAMHGWVAVGDTIYATDDGGGTWTGAPVSGATYAIHSFDTQHAVRLGKGISVTTNGGQSWTAATLSASATFRYGSWIDDTTGWASGDIQDSNGFSSKTVVFGTTDGGTSWTALASVTSVAAGPVFFVDSQDGFLATYKQQESSGSGSGSSSSGNPLDAIAHLMKTTNGGQSFTDMNLPTQVGSVQVSGFPASAIHTAYLPAMFWSDADHGHLVGAAYLGSKTSSSSGGSVSESQTTDSFRIIDYQTTDGQTWSYNDLGTIQSSLTSLPSSDGTFTGGVFTDLTHGWLAAYSPDVVWGYGGPCHSSTDCPTGTECVDGQCVGNLRGGSDGGTGGGADGGGSISIPRSADSSAKTPCRCDAFSTAAGGPLLLAMFLARRRRRTGR